MALQEELILKICCYTVCGSSIFAIYSNGVLQLFRMQRLCGIQLIHASWLRRKYHFEKPGFYDKNLAKPKMSVIQVQSYDF